MGNLAICKRIAEIDGVTVRDTGEDLEWIRCPKSAIEPKYDDYNPLTDDALCFQLMVKYKVDIEHFKCGTVSAYIEDKNHGEVIDTSPNKAILLTIIEAHKESNGSTR